MQKLVGKFNEAKVFTDNIDTETLSQIKTLLDQEFAKDSKIRIMPDTHAGKGCVIGTTMTLTDRAVPNLVGVDIGCGMLAAKLDAKFIDFQKLDKVIKNHIPSGFDVRKEPVADFDLNELRVKVRKEYTLCSIGTLGGGNHFIEVDTDKDNNFWLVIHTGSRNLGKKVCEHYQHLAYDCIARVDINSVIEELKAQGRQKEIQSVISQYHKVNEKILKVLSSVKGEDFDNYIHDMKITQEYACLNRAVILSEICKYMKWKVTDKFETIHNYIDTEKMILRKGAVSAEKGEKLIIPMNMRDGSLICIGKGNEDWNCSAPHGAGRIMSRAQARERLKLADFRDSMEGIWTSCVQKSTIDEAPMVYKPMDEIVENVKDTVDIIDIIKPVYNFKAN